MKHKLLVAVKGGKTSRRTIEYVAQMCAGNAPWCAGLVFLHVFVPIPPYVEGANPVAADKLAERTETQRTLAAKKMLADIKAFVIRAGVKPGLVATVLADRQGDMRKQILRVAAARGCDTIVVGRDNRSLLGEFLAGSVVERMLWKPIGYTIWVVE
jgi:nucleotide-binding universal stress UspA family protein